jgi:hypothetical protein
LARYVAPQEGDQLVRLFQKGEDLYGDFRALPVNLDIAIAAPSYWRSALDIVVSHLVNYNELIGGGI